MITVVGIGADGWTGLTDAARRAIEQAPEIIGSPRQLATLPPGLPIREWPKPLTPLLDEIATRGTPTCVLASGDPMLHGIGASLARRVGPEKIKVHSHPSAFALACARLGWPAAEVELISAVGRPVATIARALQPGRKVIAYVDAPHGAPDERVADINGPVRQVHAVAIDVHAGGHPRVPGLPDDAYAHDGQLTKRHVRAVTIATLAPLPGELLWDVGAGSGSIGIEWLRAEPTAQAIAIEPRADRVARIDDNAHTLGVPHLQIVSAKAPEALGSLAAPDAIFIGGGLTADGVLDACLAALKPGGRLVANGVTLETDALLHAAQREHGGTLTRIEIAHAEPLGTFTGWSAARPVTQWSVTKP